MNNLVTRPIRSLQVDTLTVHIYPTPSDVAFAASRQAQKILQSAIQQRKQAAAIFATGRSQKQCLKQLTHSAVNLDWANITGFHLDEYLGVAADHPASFRHYLNNHLTSQVTLKHFHAIAGDGLLPLDICDQYEQLLRAQPLDLSFLGIGDNGHLAFNDPDVANFDDPRWVKLVRLDEKNRQQQADSTAFASIETVPQYAFTLTLSVLRYVHNNLCLAFGQGKSNIVQTMLTGPIEPSCPASILRQIPQTTLILDSAAAGLLADK